MNGILDYDPGYRLYEILEDGLNFLFTFKNNVPEADKNKPVPKFRTRQLAIDHLLECLLLNNGCAGSDGAFQLIYDVAEDYKVHIITGMKGNKANDFFDFVMFNGTKNLIVFIDYFKDILTASKVNNIKDENNLDFLMGNSFAIDAIMKIVDVFYATYSPALNILNTTVMGMTQRKNGAIIAIHLLEKYKSVDENDIAVMPIQEIREIAEGNVITQLYGIKSMI